MTTPKTIETVESLEAERNRLAAESREVGDRLEAIAAVAFERRAAQRSAWSRAVLDANLATGERLRAAEKDAAREFHLAAAESADARSAYLTWVTAIAGLNVQHERVTQARAHLGEPQSETFYPSTEWPSYSAALDVALAAAASDLMAAGQAEFQLELNALDEIES